VHQGYWMDIGRQDDYMKAIQDLEMRGETLLNG
jgi:NDP-sugar pyrophosphorylase family protein